MTGYFTPSWRRPTRPNDVVPPSDDVDADADPYWRRYPCLVCGKPPRTKPQRGNGTSSASANSSSHKRCSRCRSAVYCSSDCQRRDYVRGKHKAHCLSLGKLWDEKSKLEKCMWGNKNKSTNPFDDEVYDYPTVGKFWHDQPRSTLEKTTTRYCVVFLQMVQLLGRAESWRVATSLAMIRRQEGSNNHDDDYNDEGSKCTSFGRRRGAGNPLSRELAIDLAYQLLHLDRTDLRVRLLIPSLLLEGGHHQEAYDFLKHWLRPEGSLLIMDLALMGGPMGGEEEDGSPEEDGRGPVDIAGGGDVVEPPEGWMDGEMVYPSVGMVFELAFLKCHLLCSLRSGRFRPDASLDAGTESGTEPPGAPAGRCAAVGADEVERQVRLLLSLVHKWNEHLLSNLGEYYDVETGASSVDKNEASSMAEEGFDVLSATPPAVLTLLNKHPPGFELQYKMGNPGGRTVDEAVSIWQRDMMLWHHADPRTMAFLSEFCSDLESNLVDTGGLNGGAAEKSRNGGQGGNGVPHADAEDDAENAAKRKEAEELVEKLRRERPERSMGEIMMHPEMARLMVKHLHTE